MDNARGEGGSGAGDAASEADVWYGAGGSGVGAKGKRISAAPAASCSPLYVDALRGRLLTTIDIPSPLAELLFVACTGALCESKISDDAPMTFCAVGKGISEVLGTVCPVAFWLNIPCRFAF